MLGSELQSGDELISVESIAYLCICQIMGLFDLLHGPPKWGASVQFSECICMGCFFLVLL